MPTKLTTAIMVFRMTDAEAEIGYYQGEGLLLEDVLREQVLLALPLKVTCREDCRGLCPICAADLNEEPEGHHHDAPRDRRWAKLSELELE